MTLRTRKNGKPPRRPTPAQQEANARSFRIFRLRGLWSFADLLTGERRDAMRALVDQELESLGAEPQTKRDAADRARWERLHALDRERAELFADLPF